MIIVSPQSQFGLVWVLSLRGLELGLGLDNLFSTLSRRQETTDCSNNLKLATQQIPSEAVLFKAGCVQELDRMVEDSLIYILGGLGTVALMGEENIEEKLDDNHSLFISRNIRHDVFTLSLLRGQKNRRLESLIISTFWIM